jgi:hypothetical protein
MSALKKIGDFTAPKDEATGLELRRQLKSFQGNVSDMGDALQAAALQRLTAGKNEQTSLGMVISPGQFQFADTSLGTVNVGLAKPTAAQAGTFIVLIDLGGSAGAFSVLPQGCKFENATTATAVTVASFAAMIFCDGVDYWRLF